MTIAELDQSDSNITSKKRLRNGYYTIKVKSHYYEISRHRMRLHRYLWEIGNKACLLKGVEVHHIDGDKANNSIGNLQALRSSDHAILHYQQKNIKRSNYFESLGTHEVTQVTCKGATFWEYNVQYKKRGFLVEKIAVIKKAGF